MNQKIIGLGVIIIMITLGTTIGTTAIMLLQIQQVHAATMSGRVWVPIASSGKNAYITWWTNKTGNNEVMFRASTDGGKSWGDKINLSNTKGADSEDAQISASGSNVYVSWWERNQTANDPVMRVSDDNGKSFGPVLHLAANGTIGGGGGG